MRINKRGISEAARSDNEQQCQFKQSIAKRFYSYW
jgi:hypothetical protein